MKNLSSVFYMWLGLGLGVLSVLMMFVPFAVYDGGTIIAARHMFWGLGESGGAWPAFAGYMLILVGALMMGVMALPFIQPTIKAEKIVLISSAAAILIGLILVGLISVEYPLLGGTFYSHLDYFHAGFYLTMVFGLGAIAMDVIALVLDW